VLTLTEAAVEAIKGLLASQDVPAGGGLRISTAPPTNGDEQPSYELAVVTGPDLTDAVVERDGEKRAAMYEALEREHQKVSPFIIMFQQIEVSANRKSVTGFVVGPSFDTNLYAGIAKN